jgi:hypothetical protein
LAIKLEPGRPWKAGGCATECLSKTQGLGGESTAVECHVLESVLLDTFKYFEMLCFGQIS